jgi:formate/nitrite transporter FocA (FNT family)
MSEQLTPIGARPVAHVTPQTSETRIERYARQTRNATVFLAWLAGIMVALSLIAGIIVGIEIANTNNTNPPGTSSIYGG